MARYKIFLRLRKTASLTTNHFPYPMSTEICLCGSAFKPAAKRKWEKKGGRG
jgi:hypothetical protein